MLIVEYNDRTLFYVQPSTLSNAEIFNSAVQERHEITFESIMDWKRYVAITKECYVIRIADGFERTLICSCPIGALKIACKHCVALAVKLGYATYPSSVDSITIEGRRKPGATRKVKGGNPLSKL